MSFKELLLKHSYNSDYDDILNDFYIPILKEAISYKRITGYFSSSSFKVAAAGIAQFIKNGGKMQFILNVKLTADDFEQIQKGLMTPEEIIESKFLQDLNNIEDECMKNHSKVLGWLLAHRFLEIKIGYIKYPEIGNEILHQKIGILTDKENNTITFSGSNNETEYGWHYNSEKFKVFFSWETNNEIFVKQDIDDFETFWNDRAIKTKIVSFPEAVRQQLIAIAPENTKELERILRNIEPTNSKNEIQLRDYQNQAIEAWFQNNNVGIFEMATGTGKTYAALGALKRLMSREKSLITIISAPYLHLCNQWAENIQSFGFTIPIIFASSINTKWKEQVIEHILNIRLNNEKFCIIITTHATLSSQTFTSIMSEIKTPILLIGDEVHGLGSIQNSEALLPNYCYRLGLSATPERYFDELGTEKLKKYFDKTVFIFDLHRAINEINPETKESYLCPYEYHPIFVELSPEEMDKYEELTKQIAILSSKENPSQKDQLFLEHILRERQDILKNAEGKFKEFHNLITTLQIEQNIDHTLVYCSPQQIEEIQAIIRRIGNIVQHKFTNEENAIKKERKYGGKTEREYLLDNFDKGNYDILVAIKCLDEGVDIPSTRTAILMCSSGNPKEYIQRRGRVLRRYPGKEKAIIYDFTALPNSRYHIDIEYERRMIDSQLKRIKEFAHDALNMSDVTRKILVVSQDRLRSHRQQ